MVRPRLSGLRRSGWPKAIPTTLSVNGEAAIERIETPIPQLGGIGPLLSVNGEAAIERIETRGGTGSI